MSEKQPVYRSTEDERRYESTYFNPEKVHARALQILAEAEIKPETFRGLYDPALLERDAKEVARLEAIFERTPSIIHADILEAIVCHAGELNEWFGPDSQIIKTSRFDDIKNKVDMIIETAVESGQFSHLALGIDITFGSRVLGEKFASIKEKIDRGTLAEIRYFHSDRQHYTGRKRRVPQVVIGIQIERVQELGLLWMNRRNAELSAHPVQVTILEQASQQLETFARYATRIGKPDIATILELELQKINELLEQKKSEGLKGIKEDKVFEEIKKNLALFEEAEAASA